LVEFTGERVIPGQVNQDLWNEHVARYAYARLFADRRRVLDAGCGTGYGAAELAQSAIAVTGVDIAVDAIQFARGNYPIPGLGFLAASCTSLPFPENSFELVVAFEVIEHLRDFRPFLKECSRVMTPQGLFIVSSPNKSYYGESRAKSGPNPYHEHEFEAAEFVTELSREFSNVRLLLQNRVESFAFHPANTFWPAETRIDGGGGNAGDANFLIGMCSFGPLPDPKSFVYVPKAANLLREREQHIQRLKTQVEQARTERDTLLALHRKLNEELESRNRWAENLNGELNASGERIAQLQQELVAEQQAANVVASGYESKVRELEQENRAKTEWARATELRLNEELEEKCRELSECVRLLETAEATVAERTLWAQRVEAQREELAAQMNFIRASRWLKLGRKIGLGPVIKQS